ncbi:MAG: CocE/NonD family hydrolase [Rhodanobacteraceae bacterium]
MRWVCALCLVLATLPVLAASPKQADAGYIVQNPVLIKLKDGVTLSAIIVRKKGVTQPLPATLFFTPYSQGPGDVYFAKAPAERGFVGVVVYSRGIRTNIKDFVPYVHDGEDAREAIEWIARQPWCNGKVGMFGGSYVGFVQWAVARDPPAALKTIVPQVAVMPGIDSPMENNVFQSFMFRWANNILGFPPPAADLYVRWYRSGLPYRQLDLLDGHPNRIFQQWLDHPAYDSYWRSLAPAPGQYANLKIPILVTDGYYDGAQIGSMQYVRDYFRYNKHPDLYLVLGPWDHFGAQRSAALTLMGYKIDPVANVSMRKLAFEWLDWILKGAQKPKLLQNRINYEVMGANQWKHIASLDAMHDRTLTLYFSGTRNGSGYLLDPVAPARASHVEQTVDFRDRSTQNNDYTRFIVLKRLDSSHGLVFATRPFEHAFSIDGSFAGELVASINRRDVDFSIAVYELMPDGRYFYLAHDLGRASYAHDRSRRELLAPGRKTKIPLHDTNIVSKRIAKGSRLVVVLNVNKNPYMEINYGTGKPVTDESMKDAGQPLRIEWYNDSRITVPVMSDPTLHAHDGGQ